MKPEIVIETARLMVGEDCEKIESPSWNRLDVYLKQTIDLVPIVAGLRVKRVGFLTAITGLDLGVESDELEVLYHFCTGCVVITLRIRVPKIDAWVPTLSEIIPSAEPFERELMEMFGVKVVGLRNPEPLYLPEDWEKDCFPLRKGYQPQEVMVRMSGKGV